VAARLFSRHAPEVWAAVLPTDGRGAAGATFHVLVAPPCFHLIAPGSLAAMRPQAALWIAAAADAVAAVRVLPAATVQARRGVAPCGQPQTVTQLARDADRANALLREHCERTPGPAWQPDLFKTWGTRVSVVGIPTDVSSTSRNRPSRRNFYWGWFRLPI
jgi:hypothetical protein